MIRRVDENWAEGMLADKIGIFPISYVEVSQSVETSVVLVFCLANQSSVCNLSIQKSSGSLLNMYLHRIVVAHLELIVLHVHYVSVKLGGKKERRKPNRLIKKKKSPHSPKPQERSCSKSWDGIPLPCPTIPEDQETGKRLNSELCPLLRASVCLLSGTLGSLPAPVLSAATLFCRQLCGQRPAKVPTKVRDACFCLLTRSSTCPTSQSCNSDLHGSLQKTLNKQ